MLGYRWWDYLTLIALLVIGAVTAFSPETVMVPEFGWVWQIIVGIALFFAGIALMAVVEHTNHWPRTKAIYALSGFCILMIGVIVFANFNRYGSILATTGSWPLWTCGGILIASIPALIGIDFFKARSHERSNETSM